MGKGQETCKFKLLSPRINEAGNGRPKIGDFVNLSCRLMLPIRRARHRFAVKAGQIEAVASGLGVE
jgi:hypothetical protein